MLISREIRISGFSLENPEGDVKDVIIFLKKMIYFGDRADFNTLVLKSLILQDLENDRPVGRSFSRNRRIEILENLEDY